MTSLADEIDRLAAQHAAGRLTDAEFEAAKARLLSSPPAPVYPAIDAAAASVHRLRRSVSDRWLGGVCGGIAKMAGVDSWIVRLVFVVATLFAGVGLLPYLLLWIFVPSEGS